MVHIRPERFPLGFIQPLQARSVELFKVLQQVRPNAYVIYIPPSHGTSSSFNVKDLVPYNGHTVIPSALSRNLPLTPTRRHQSKTWWGTTRLRLHMNHQGQPCSSLILNCWSTTRVHEPDLTGSSFSQPGRVGVGTIYKPLITCVYGCQCQRTAQPMTLWPNDWEPEIMLLPHLLFSIFILLSC